MGLSLIASVHMNAADQDCLSANFNMANNRPVFVMERQVATNTSVELHWVVNVDLTNCDEPVFSIPPYSFDVEYELDQLVGPIFFSVRVCCCQ